MAKRKAHMQKSARKRQQGEKRTLGNITCRTKYLDDLIILFTQSCHSILPAYFQALTQAAASACQQPPQQVKQVVLVGSGMDTRALRLDVTDDVHWFELDRSRVLHVKQLILRRKMRGLQRRVTQASYVSFSDSLVCNIIHPLVSWYATELVEAPVH